MPTSPRNVDAPSNLEGGLNMERGRGKKAGGHAARSLMRRRGDRNCHERGWATLEEGGRVGLRREKKPK